MASKSKPNTPAPTLVQYIRMVIRRNRKKHTKEMWRLRRLSVTVLLVVVGVNAQPRLVCPVCTTKQLKSYVYQGWCSTALADCIPFYHDKDGALKNRDFCAGVYCKYTCSNGHEFSLRADGKEITVNKDTEHTPDRSTRPFDFIPTFKANATSLTKCKPERIGGDTVVIHYSCLEGEVTVEVPSQP